jgi:hypothetical protein
LGHVAAALAGFRAASPDRGAIAQSNVVKGQKLYPDILEGALNGIGGCRIWRPAFELEIIDSSVANRSRAPELANRPA